MKNKILIITEGHHLNFTAISRSFERAFSQRCEVDLFDFHPKIEFLDKVMNKIFHIYISAGRKEENELLNRIYEFQPVLLLIIKGTYLRPSLLKELKRRFSDIQIVCFNPDDPFNRCSCNLFVEKSITYYDHYYIWTKRLLESLSKKGTHAHYLPFAVDKELVFPVKKTSDILEVSFIGNGDSERVNWLTNIITCLNKSEIEMTIFGTNWPQIRGIKLFDKVEGEKFSEVIGKSKISLNILRKQNKNSTNMRTFEIPAAGGFMLHEYSEEAMEIFRPDIEAVYFRSSEEAADKISYFLNNERLRNSIAINGYKLATSFGSSYDARVSTIMEILKIN